MKTIFKIIFIFILILFGLSVIKSPLFFMLIEKAVPKIGLSNSSTFSNGQFKINSANNKLTVTAESQSNWPSGTKAGLFKLTSDKSQFDSLASISVNLKEYPGPGFAFGYWDPDKKQWNYTPTIRRSLKVYDAILPHASYLGGRQVSPQDVVEHIPSYVTNTAIIQNLQAFQQRYVKIQEAKVKNKTQDATYMSNWSYIYEVLNTIVKYLKQDCQSKSDLNTKLTFYYIWGLSQLAGRDDLEREFRGMENQCGVADFINKNPYLIQETDPWSMDLNLGSYVKINDKSQIQYDGVMVPDFSGRISQPAWKGEWELSSFVTTNATGNIRLPIYSGDTFMSGDTQAVYTFNLTGLGEGRSFATNWVSSSDLNSYTYGSMATFSSTNSPGVVTGIIVKDYGDQGALIRLTFGYNKEAQAQMEQMRQMAKDIPMFREYTDQLMNIPTQEFLIRKAGSAEPTPLPTK